jgi:uncharacterized membrane protein
MEIATDLKLFVGLLIAFQVKHFVADFPLQTPYMLRKTVSGWDFVVPLGVHCLIHAVMTLTIVLYVQPQLWWLALVDFAIHFLMDRFKSGPRYLGRFNDPSKTPFWVALGFDQMVHHLTHLWIVWYLVTSAAS